MGTLQSNTFDPMRSPSWRKERVMTLISRDLGLRRPLRKYDDKYVRAYKDFFLKFEQATRRGDPMSVFPTHPELYYAHRLDFDNDSAWQSIIQARLLTGESDQQIANRMATMPGTIDWYEKLFFNVRDRLYCQDWIVRFVLGGAGDETGNRDGSFTLSQRDLTYRLFGYFGGPLALDMLISGFSHRGFPTSVADLPKWYDSTTTNMLRSKASASAKLFVVNRYNVMQLFEIQLGIMDASKEKDPESQQNQYEKQIGSMLAIMPWTLSKRAEDERSELQQKFSQSYIEPRADEQLHIAAGQVPESLMLAESTLKRITFEKVEGQG